MNPQLLIILLVVVVLYFVFMASRFTSSTQTKPFLESTYSDRQAIATIIGDPEYSLLIKYVPEQVFFTISGTPPTLTKDTIPGDASKITQFKGNAKLIEKTNTLMKALSSYINTAQTSTDVYTQDKLKAFVLYYQTMLNNIGIINNFLQN